MSDLRFTKDHEYIRLGPDGVATVGVTDYAQSQLGDVVFVELPKVGASVEQGAEAAVVESVKAASGVNAPAAGEVVEVNAELEERPALVNEDPAGAGWFMKLKLADPSQVEALMDEAAYDAFVRALD